MYPKPKLRSLSKRLELPKGKPPGRQASGAPPTGKGQFTGLCRTSRTLACTPLALFSQPPPTVALTPLAVLLHPPPTVASSPLAVLLYPPPTVA